jgi:hypothetical protein
MVLDKELGTNVPPAPRDRLIIAMAPATENYLGNDTVSEHDEDEDSKEFGKGFSKIVPDSAPCQIWFLLDSLSLGDLVINQGTVFCIRRHARHRGTSAGSLRDIAVRVLFVSGLSHCGRKIFN